MILFLLELFIRKRLIDEIYIRNMLYYSGFRIQWQWLQNIVTSILVSCLLCDRKYNNDRKAAKRTTEDDSGRWPCKMNTSQPTCLSAVWLLADFTRARVLLRLLFVRRNALLEPQGLVLYWHCWDSIASPPGVLKRVGVRERSYICG